MSKSIVFHGSVFLSLGEEDKATIVTSCPYCGNTNRHDPSELIVGSGILKCDSCNSIYHYQSCTVEIILPKQERDGVRHET